MTTHDATGETPGVVDYDRLAADYADRPVTDAEIVGPVELGTTILRKGRPMGARTGETPVSSVRLPEGLSRRLLGQAKRERASQSEVIRRAVSEYLDRHAG